MQVRNSRNTEGKSWGVLGSGKDLKFVSVHGEAARFLNAQTRNLATELPGLYMVAAKLRSSLHENI
jgi:hypothetical protein